MAKRRSSGMEPEDKGVQGFHSPSEGVEGGRGVGEQGPQSKGLGSQRQDKEADTDGQGSIEQLGRTSPSSDMEHGLESLDSSREDLAGESTDELLREGGYRDQQDQDTGQPIEQSNRGGTVL